MFSAAVISPPRSTIHAPCTRVKSDWIHDYRTGRPRGTLCASGGAATEWSLTPVGSRKGPPHHD